MIKLSERIGRDRLDALVNAYACKAEGSKALYDEAVGTIAEHLMALQEDGTVVPHTSLPNRRMNLQHSWNVMCGITEHPYSSRENETGEVAERMAHALLGMPLMMLAYDLERGTIGPAEREAAMKKAIARMDSGDIAWWNVSSREHDFVTGESLDVEFLGWNVVFGRRGARGEGLVPAEDVAPIAMHVVEIDVPTGELLIADWFRDDDFTQLVDEGNIFRGGSQQENEMDAERYARDHGFVSVCSARRSLTAFRKGNRISVGRHDEDGDHRAPKGYRRLKDILIDLRKVSIADRASLLTSMGRVHPPERAAELVARIVADRGTVKLKVTPGRYRVLSSGRGYIEDLLDDGDPLKTDGYEPTLVIERV